MVRRTVSAYGIGLGPEEIAARIGHLSVGQVYAALTYSHANRTEIDADIAAEVAATAALKVCHA